MMLENCYKEEIFLEEGSVEEITRKYGGEEGGWCLRVSREKYGMVVWKTIRRRWENFNDRIRVEGGQWTKDRILKG